MRFDRDKLALLPVVEKRLGVYHNVPIRFRSFRFRARFLGGLEVRAVWISLRVKGRWTKNRLLLSTDPTMPPEAIIRLYADRWTIEPMFNSLKACRRREGTLAALKGGVPSLAAPRPGRHGPDGHAVAAR